jgi:addiction module HigA family antidote
LGLTITAVAAGLVLNGHTGISPEMAIRLPKGFGGSAESWLRQQMLYDLAQAEEHADKIQVKRLSAA